MDATRYAHKPMYKGFFLPNLSSMGPYNNCPTEMPMKKLDKERVTCATVECRLSAIAGNAGRYISIENGPIAESNPRISTRWNLLFAAMLIRNVKLMQQHVKQQLNVRGSDG
jgi:hypothetical protein